jgi:amino acid transporter
MAGDVAGAVESGGGEDARLRSLGYTPQLNRVLGLFSNFAVAFTYLSPMVGIYSLFVIGLGMGGPAYIWLTFIPVAGMLFVALVFGSLRATTPSPGRSSSTASSPSALATAGSSAGSTASPS